MTENVSLNTNPLNVDVTLDSVKLEIPSKANESTLENMQFSDFSTVDKVKFLVRAASLFPAILGTYCLSNLMIEKLLPFASYLTNDETQYYGYSNSGETAIQCGAISLALYILAAELPETEMEKKFSDGKLPVTTWKKWLDMQPRVLLFRQ